MSSITFQDDKTSYFDRLIKSSRWKLLYSTRLCWPAQRGYKWVSVYSVSLVSWYRDQVVLTCSLRSWRWVFFCSVCSKTFLSDKTSHADLLPQSSRRVLMCSTIFPCWWDQVMLTCLIRVIGECKCARYLYQLMETRLCWPAHSELQASFNELFNFPSWWGLCYADLLIQSSRWVLVYSRTFLADRVDRVLLC